MLGSPATIGSSGWRSFSRLAADAPSRSTEDETGSEKTAWGKGACFLLIHDERNPTFLTEQNGERRGRYKRFKQLLTCEVSDRVFILSIQRIAKYLEGQGRHAWLAEFKHKYL